MLMLTPKEMKLQRMQCLAKGKLRKKKGGDKDAEGQAGLALAGEGTATLQVSELGMEENPEVIASVDVEKVILIARYKGKKVASAKWQDRQTSDTRYKWSQVEDLSTLPLWDTLEAQGTSKHPRSSCLTPKRIAERSCC